MNIVLDSKLEYKKFTKIYNPHLAIGYYVDHSTK